MAPQPTARGLRGKGEEPGRVGVATGWDKVWEGTAAETWLPSQFLFQG